MARENFDGQTPYNPAIYGGIMQTEDRWDNNGVRLDENGKAVGNIIKGNASGEQMDVDRYQQMGQGMQQRDPYKFDWSQSDKDHAQANQAGDLQGNANEQWRRQATGEDKTSFMYGRSLVDRGAQNQQAAALSSAGDPLAQAGASLNAQQARGAFMQKGMQGVNAQQADDMAAGRAGYAQGLSQQRKMDQTGQSLSDQQTELEANAAAQQRKLNDAGQYGMDKLTNDVHQQALSARQHQAALVDKMNADRKAASDAADARSLGYVSAGISAIPGAGPVLSAGMGAAKEADDPTSDERAKDKRPANALLDMVQTPSRMSGHKPPVNSWDEDHGMAPGTRDVLKYGTPSARSENGMDDFSKAIMTSDERAKSKAETPEEKKAREDKEDADATAKFMGDAPKDAYTVKKPTSYEEASKAIDERHAQDKQIAADEKRREQAPAIDYANRHDAANKQMAEKIRGVPLVGEWARDKAASHDAETDDQKAERGLAWRKDEIESLATKKKWDDRAKSILPEFLRTASSQSPVSVGYRPEHDSRQAGAVRQPTSFKREESTSDERAKSKAKSGYEDTSIHSLGYEGKDGGDTTVTWDNETKGRGHTRDVVIGEVGSQNGGEGPSGSARLGGNTGGRVNLADAERARGEAIAAKKAAESAARPPPGARKPGRHTDDELKRMGDEMLGNVKAQSDAQLEAGPSVKDKSSWLDDYMTSDEGSKSKGGNALLEMQKDANRKLRGETYTYKEGFGEDPNQVHHGFMAQNLEQNPITATAVREDETGVKKVNNEDAIRVTAAGVASNQEQIDELADAIDALAARRGKKRVA